jgi:hypothetical protein
MNAKGLCFPFFGLICLIYSIVYKVNPCGTQFSHGTVRALPLVAPLRVTAYKQKTSLIEQKDRGQIGAEYWKIILVWQQLVGDRMSFRCGNVHRVMFYPN